jgi:hypothetical protein
MAGGSGLEIRRVTEYFYVELLIFCGEVAGGKMLKNFDVRLISFNLDKMFESEFY